MKGKEKETKKEREAKLDIARMKAGQAINQVNQKIDELGRNTKIIHDKITELQIVFDAIRNIPSEKYLEYKKLQRIRLNWKQQAEKIELDYRNAEIRSAGAGAAGVGLGAAVVALGPTNRNGCSNNIWSCFDGHSDICIEWRCSNQRCIGLVRWWSSCCRRPEAWLQVRLFLHLLVRWDGLLLVFPF